MDDEGSGPSSVCSTNFRRFGHSASGQRRRSGGQQQLVAIGRALVTNPSYLLCDEVSLGLSPLAVTDVYALLRKASAGGTAVVLVEQNVNRALSESDRFYCLQKGRVMLEGESAVADRAKVAQAYFGV